MAMRCRYMITSTPLSDAKSLPRTWRVPIAVTVQSTAHRSDLAARAGAHGLDHLHVAQRRLIHSDRHGEKRWPPDRAAHGRGRRPPPSRTQRRAAHRRPTQPCDARSSRATRPCQPKAGCTARRCSEAPQLQGSDSWRRRARRRGKRVRPHPPAALATPRTATTGASRRRQADGRPPRRQAGAQLAAQLADTSPARPAPRRPSRAARRCARLQSARPKRSVAVRQDATESQAR
jgi:hypothetical protein